MLSNDFGPWTRWFAQRAVNASFVKRGQYFGPFRLDSVEGECDAGKGIQVAANVK